VTPPPAAGYDQNGKEYKPPTFCTVKDLADITKKVAEATKQAAKIKQTANISRAAAALARKQALKMTPAKAKLANDVARGLDMLAGLLDQQAQKLIDKASEKTCLDAPAVEGGRF
jgi:hypothetical protein